MPDHAGDIRDDEAQKDGEDRRCCREKNHEVAASFVLAWELSDQYCPENVDNYVDKKTENARLAHFGRNPHGRSDREGLETIQTHAKEQRVKRAEAQAADD